MADKKFGQKRVCGNCEVKFYDLNKKSPLTCPHCKNEIAIDDELALNQISQAPIQQNKSEIKDEFTDIDNRENDDEAVISLDDAALEEEEGQENKN